MNHIGTLNGICGADHVVSSGAEFDACLTDWRGRYRGHAIAMVLPQTAQQVQQIVQYCREHKISITPQGGNTGMCGGATPQPQGHNIIVNCKKMSRILECNPVANTITVESGCTLLAAQISARDCNRSFPLTLTPADQVQLGGAAATNAGGLNVIKYGMMRQSILGIEAVMADGSLYNNLFRLHKNNSGYDIKQLLIGSEGTLGIITKLCVKLYPLAKTRHVAIAGLKDFKHCVGAFDSIQTVFGHELSAFEYIGGDAWNIVCDYLPSCPKIFTQKFDHYLLVEWDNISADSDLRGRIESHLGGMAQIADYKIAGDAAAADEFWRLRKSIPAAEKNSGISVKHDISVPIDRWDDFLNETLNLLRQKWPQSRPVYLGHLGDGNLHFNVVLPQMGAENIGDYEPAINDLVYGQVTKMGGSISAEHGIGQLRRGSLAKFGDPAQYRMMQKIKQTLDPDGLFNPGKIF